MPTHFRAWLKISQQVCRPHHHAVLGKLPPIFKNRLVWLAAGSHESLEKHPGRLLPADWLPLCVQGESERRTHGSFEWQKEHALLSSPLAMFFRLYWHHEKHPGSKGEGNAGAVRELAALTFNRHRYLKHLWLKPQRHLEAWAKKWCSASSPEVSTWLLALCCVHPRGTFAGGKGKLNAPRAWHPLLLEKLMIKWLVGSYLLSVTSKSWSRRDFFSIVKQRVCGEGNRSSPLHAFQGTQDLTTTW